MALQKREKKMLKILAGVAVVSAFILYRTFNPSIDQEEVTDQVVGDVQNMIDERDAAIASTSGGGGGARRGGGSRGGGSSSGGGSGVSPDMLAQHSKPTDCWVVIKGEVRDISGLIQSNPTQADELSQFCGTLGFEAGFLAENPEYKSLVNSQSSSVGTIQ